MIIERKTCRICENPIETIFSLGDFYMSDFVDKPEDEGIKCPLELVLCQNPACQLLQLKHTAPQEKLYSNHYWYKSGINEKIVNDLKEIAETAIKISKIQPGDTFIDVGANDGTLLSFVPNDIRRVGIEPAVNLQEDLKKHAIAVPEFWENYESELKAKVITAIGMFYDCEDPNKFIANVARHLLPNGLFIAQLMTLTPMVENNDVGNICHEHLEYYSYKSLKHLFEKNGLEIFQVELNDINGGSYRIFARPYRKGSIDFREKEYTKQDYLNFYERIKSNRQKMNEFMAKELTKGKKVYGYAASTKGNTILQFYQLDNRFIKAIAERNPEKWGKLTIGTNIPIISEEEARKDADYFIILPWGFKDIFMKREKDWLSNGGKFLTHTPGFGIL